MDSVTDCMVLKDPLTRKVAQFILGHKEEDQFLDYKQTVDIKSEKEWLGLTKDVSAFANTFGGYLIFGVSDEDKRVIGLDHSVESFLKDTDKLMAKLNRFLEPTIQNLRTKSFRFDSRPIVVCYIPQSVNVTHVIKKDGDYTLPSGDKKNVLRQGTLYVRRVGGNHLGDSRDLDDLVDRRIDAFREALLGKVATVVNAPIESQVFLLSQDPNDTTGQRFVIEDSPDAIGVKGLSFSVAPETQEEEVAAWTVLARSRPSSIPPIELVWDWYKRRREMKVSETYRLSLFRFSLVSQVPAMYWIQEIENTKIKPILLDAIRSRPASIPAVQFLETAAFLGKAAYRDALKAFGPYQDRIGPRMKTYPTKSPHDEFASFRKTVNETKAQFRKSKQAELDAIAESAVNARKSPGVMKVSHAQKLDYFLYARNDNYKRVAT